MDNKYLFAVVGGVFLFLWFWVGVQDYYAMEGGGISTVFLFTAFLVLALGGGDSDGTDLVSTITGSLSGFVGKFIGLLIAYIVGSALYSALATDAGFDFNMVIEAVATLFASGIVIILAAACLKKSG